MGVTDAQASRWTSSEPIGVPAERFLRILAVLGPVALAQRNLPEAKVLPTKGLIETLGHLPSKDEPVMNPEDHDNNRMRLMHLLRLKPVQ